MKRLFLTLVCFFAVAGTVAVSPIETRAGTGLSNIFEEKKSDKRKAGKISTTGGPIAGTTVSLSGRVVTPTGKFIRNATLVLIDLDGPTQVAVSGSMGNYAFSGIIPGRTYVLGVFHPRYLFASPTQTIEINSDQTGVILIGEDDQF